MKGSLKNDLARSTMRESEGIGERNQYPAQHWLQKYSEKNKAVQHPLYGFVCENKTSYAKDVHTLIPKSMNVLPVVFLSGSNTRNQTNKNKKNQPRLPHPPHIYIVRMSRIIPSIIGNNVQNNVQGIERENIKHLRPESLPLSHPHRSTASAQRGDRDSSRAVTRHVTCHTLLIHRVTSFIYYLYLARQDANTSHDLTVN